MLFLVLFLNSVCDFFSLSAACLFTFFSSSFSFSYGYFENLVEYFCSFSHIILKSIVYRLSFFFHFLGTTANNKNSTAYSPNNNQNNTVNNNNFINNNRDNDNNVNNNNINNNNNANSDNNKSGDTVAVDILPSRAKQQQSHIPVGAGRYVRE